MYTPPLVTINGFIWQVFPGHIVWEPFCGQAIKAGLQCSKSRLLTIAKTHFHLHPQRKEKKHLTFRRDRRIHLDVGNLVMGTEGRCIGGRFRVFLALTQLIIFFKTQNISVPRWDSSSLQTSSSLKIIKIQQSFYCLVAKLYATLRPHGLEPARLFCPWDFPGRNTGVGCNFLLQGLFPTQ